MPMSDYMQALRDLVGSRLLLLPGVAAIIRDTQGRVLVLRTPTGMWTLPAGGIEPGESPAQAVAREVREETGLVVTEARLLDVFGGAEWRTTYDNGHQVEYVVCTYSCEIVGELVCDGVEIAEARWVPGAEVPALLSLPYPARLFA